MVWVCLGMISISFCAGSIWDPSRSIWTWKILEASEVALSFSKTAFLAPEGSEGTLDGLDLLAIVRYSNIL